MRWDHPPTPFLMRREMHLGRAEEDSPHTLAQKLSFCSFLSASAEVRVPPMQLPHQRPNHSQSSSILTQTQGRPRFYTRPGLPHCRGSVTSSATGDVTPRQLWGAAELEHLPACALL